MWISLFVQMQCLPSGRTTDTSALIRPLYTQQSSIQTHSTAYMLPYRHKPKQVSLDPRNSDSSFVNDWMRAVKRPTSYRVGSAVHINTYSLAKIGVVMLCILMLALFLLPAADYNPKFPQRATMHSQYNGTYPLSKPERVANGWRHRIGVITDLDTESKHPSKSNTWISYYLKGYLIVSQDHDKATVEWDNEFTTLESAISSKGRGMELSELVVFNGKLYSCDDRTGIVSEITPDGKVLPWAMLNDGDGKQVKGFKCEWLTVKDEALWVGGLGKEWTTTTGVVQNFWPQWVKSIGHTGDIIHHDWVAKYNKLRQVAGFEPPGYMIHESGVWSDIHQQWFFLPRRASTETYEETADEKRATNILFRTDDNFEKVSYSRIGPFQPTHGFSSFRFVPGTKDSLIVALKSEEKDAIPVASYIMVFNLDGDVIMDETRIGDFHFKFEGIDFV